MATFVSSHCSVSCRLRGGDARLNSLSSPQQAAPLAAVSSSLSPSSLSSPSSNPVSLSLRAIVSNSASASALSSCSSSAFYSGVRVLTPSSSVAWRENGRGRAVVTVARQSAVLEVEEEEDKEEEPPHNFRNQDFYTVLGVHPEAAQEEIKSAYYGSMKVCHPDLTGNDSTEAHEFCIFLNEVYETLSDPNRRAVYDEVNGFAVGAYNPFDDITTARDKVFVDEFTCIGCKNCVHTAPDTFELEELFGRARAVRQGDARDLVQEAIETCPVNCIHWVSPVQHKLLEQEMKRVERVGVASMMTGMGANGADVFAAARDRWEKRHQDTIRRVEMEAYKKAERQGTWWSWGFGVKEMKERAEKRRSTPGESAVARAARWTREKEEASGVRRETRALPAPREA